MERVLASALPRGACKARDGHSWGFETLGMLDFREVRVQDLFEFEEAQDREAETRAIGGILLDRSGYKAGLLDSETLIAPDNRVMLIIHRIFPSDLMEGELKAEDYEEIKRLFQGKDLKDLEGIIDRIVAPEIKGRGKAKLAAALTALSPRWFRISQYGAIPGCLRCLFFGDPRTGKGAILRWFSKKGIAGHAVGETAARTGLIYSIDPELRILSWGILPLNDGRMVVLEGLHGLSAEEMERFREVLAQQRVEVHRVVRGAAWCRTRLLADVNPNQPSLASNYPCVCLALLDCKPFYRPTDLTRWDLFIPFKREDVSPNEMYGDEGLPSSSSVKQEEKAYLSLVEWAWSRGTEDIRVDEGALKEAKLQFEALLNEFGSEALPIVHNASFWTILRLSIAVAALEFSSQDNRNLLVEAKHVKEASAFFKESLEALELREAKAIYEEEPLSKEEAERLKEGLSNQG
ncbi:MAG: hypothetical protein QW231_05545, partial [Candidatus Bathyarchaeia archaeon]